MLKKLKKDKSDVEEEKEISGMYSLKKNEIFVSLL